MIYVRLADLPVACRAFCTELPDGNYDIYLSDRLAQSQARKALMHELVHIYRGDLKKPVQSAEMDVISTNIDAEAAEIIYCGDIGLSLQ